MKPLIGYGWSEGRSKQVSYVSQDRHIHEFSVAEGGHWQHADLTTLAGAPLADSRFIIGFSWPEAGTKQVAYIGQNSHIHELWTSVGGQWQHADLTAITGAPPAKQVTTGYIWSEGRSKQIVYVGDDDHIHELFVELGGYWKHVDLTALTSAPLPGSNFMVGFGWSEGRSKQVVYAGRDGHVYELFAEMGRPWMHEDLTLLTNAPRAVDISVGFDWKEARSKQIAFVGEDGHIHELFMAPGARWMHGDLTSMTNAPQAMNIITGFAWPQGRSKQIAYFGLDGHIHELYAEIGRPWMNVDLTMLANAPLTSVNSLDGFSWETGNSKQVVYVGNDGQIRELWMTPMSNWTYTNLSETVLALPVRF